MDADTISEINSDTEFPDPALGKASFGSRLRSAAPGIIRGVLGVPMPSSGTGSGGGFTARSAITGNQASNPEPSSSSGGLSTGRVNWSATDPQGSSEDA